MSLMETELGAARVGVMPFSVENVLWSDGVGRSGATAVQSSAASAELDKGTFSLCEQH